MIKPLIKAYALAFLIYAAAGSIYFLFYGQTQTYLAGPALAVAITICLAFVAGAYLVGASLSRFVGDAKFTTYGFFGLVSFACFGAASATLRYDAFDLFQLGNVGTYIVLIACAALSMGLWFHLELNKLAEKASSTGE